MTKTTLVKEFLKKFDVNYVGVPRELPESIYRSKIEHLHEELKEYTIAVVVDCDLEKQLDALVDLTYVAIGTAVLHGFDFDEAFKRVHEANMKKIRTKLPDHKFGIVKPEGWKPPDLSDLVRSKDVK